MVSSSRWCRSRSLAFLFVEPLPVLALLDVAGDRRASVDVERPEPPRDGDVVLLDQLLLPIDEEASEADLRQMLGLRREVRVAVQGLLDDLHELPRVLRLVVGITTLASVREELLLLLLVTHVDPLPARRASKSLVHSAATPAHVRPMAHSRALTALDVGGG